jgi:uncharacterized protein involved in type VI secretion and phage assembly
MLDDIFKVGLTTPFEAVPRERKIYGVALAVVINIQDVTGEARVQLMLPWMPGFSPWARLATLMAGMNRGSYFVPQVGEEVLVAFNHGDVREPFVIGSLWNTLDRPPALAPTDPYNIRRIRSPLGHELSFDDALQSVELTTNLQTRVTLDATQATLSTPSASVTLGMAGDVSISASTRLTLEAPLIEIKSSGALNLEGQAATTLKSTAACVVQGSVVKIN